MTGTLAWLERLVAEPTLSPAPNLALIAGLCARLEAAGAECTLFPDATGTKANLLARLGPDRRDGLVLSGHLDVVPAEGQDWSVAPFAATRRGSRIHGRGTTDMKGFVACALSLAERLEPDRLERPLWLALSHDEETGCRGVPSMIAGMAARGLRPDLVLVGEATSMQIGLGHKGKMSLTVTCRGEPRHSSEAPLALNALHLAGDFLAGLRRLQDELAATGPQEAGYSVPYTTLHAGRMTGGTIVNMVPETAEILMEARPVGAEDIAMLAARIRAVAAEAARPFSGRFPGERITVQETGRYPGLSMPEDLPAVALLRECLPAATGTCRLSYGTEAGLYAEGLGAPALVCGPGHIAQAHRPDEFIDLSQLDACDRMLDALAKRACGAAA
ncbi:acetylornithine deacetylase [Mangrovicoccus sp. HB161399]|uniref:acetylornithine deacetylase n=1 Tax=Mangrovicoccus sp. HB161399 TaxID=2720392 RepID=UPI001557D354|nr:acetylornithine deacetylase [Mangrovicoccus sp. HB161399]